MVKKSNSGFTVVELLIVIVVIGILAAIVINTFIGAQDKARTAKSESELQLLDTAILTLVTDTDKWPNGCIVGAQNNPEAYVELAVAGLAEVPPVGVVDTNCEWTSANVASWQGPYLADEGIIDAWDNSYIFDPDYYPYQNCPSITDIPVLSAVVTLGEDGLAYTCDDIYRVISD